MKKILRHFIREALLKEEATNAKYLSPDMIEFLKTLGFKKGPYDFTKTTRKGELTVTAVSSGHIIVIADGFSDNVWSGDKTFKDGQKALLFIKQLLKGYK